MRTLISPDVEAELVRATQNAIDTKDIGDATEKVLQGIAWCKIQGLDWKKACQEKHMFMGACDRCVLAIAGAGTFGRALDQYKLTLEQAVSLGFHPGGANVSKTDPLSIVLTVLWKAAATHEQFC